MKSVVTTGTRDSAKSCVLGLFIVAIILMWFIYAK